MDYLTNKILYLPVPTPRPILQYETLTSKAQFPDTPFVTAPAVGYRIVGTKAVGSKESKTARLH